MEESRKRSNALGIILRTPGVLMIELLYMQSLSLKHLNVLSSDIRESSWNIDVLLYLVAWLLILLPVRVLMRIYIHLITGLCIAGSHYLLTRLLVTRKILYPHDYFELERSISFHANNASWLSHTCNHTFLDKCVSVFLFQCFLGLLSCWLIKSKFSSLFVYLWPLLPWVSGGYSTFVLVKVIQLSHVLSLTTVVMYMTNTLEQIFINVKLMMLKVKLVISLFGWQGITTWAQDEYQVQHLLVTCWLLRFLVQFYANVKQNISVNDLSDNIFETLSLEPREFSSGAIFLVFIFLTLVQCLTTTVNLFGLACIVKDIVRLQYFLIRSWLHWSPFNHPPDSVSGPLTGAIDGVTLLIMTLYTDILNFNVEGRFVLLVYILFTIASSQFQSIFSIIDPILMTLATAHTGSLWKHFRTVLIALLLLIVSGLLSYVSFFTMRSSFWIFIVAYNYINTFSLMLGSLAIYFILMIDYLTLRGWNSLDDVMFYIRGACRGVEFCVTLCMCGYIMMTFYNEMTSIAGIVMLAVYTYYCIVQRGGKGWKIWTMRRQASNKVCSLPKASKSTLEEKKRDLCPICYQSMDCDVRVMHCGHLFHENCLKKWFYIQDKCPMCYMEYNPQLNNVKMAPGVSNENTSDTNLTTPEQSDGDRK